MKFKAHLYLRIEKIPATESLLKMMKKTTYFILTALFGLKIFKCSS